MLTQKKSPVDQFELGYILMQSAVLGWVPKLCAELEVSLGTEPRSEEWMGSSEEGGLILPQIVPKVAFHQQERR